MRSEDRNTPNPTKATEKAKKVKDVDKNLKSGSKLTLGWEKYTKRALIGRYSEAR